MGPAPADAALAAALGRPADAGEIIATLSVLAERLHAGGRDRAGQWSAARGTHGGPFGIMTQSPL